MSARNDETYLFVVEWYDPMPQLKRKYLLKYFTEQHSVEMVDLKSKKIFLKKSPCPDYISKEDFIIGGKVLLYSRELDIVDYGDLKTKDRLQYQIQQVVVILGSDMYSNWGKVIDLLTNKFTLIKIRTALISQNVADNICQIFELNPRRATSLTSGVSLVAVLNAEDGFNKLAELSNTIELLVGSSDLFFYSNGGTQSSECTTLLFDKYPTVLNTSTLDNCTCCVIKPHAVKSRNVGKIIHEIISQGYEISAISNLMFDRIKAEEFLEVYKDVVPDYSDHVMQLTNGPSVALEIRAQDAVQTFRQSAGPWDVDMAKEVL